MPKFEGFPPGKIPQFQLPALFISDLLPLIDDLAELKIILFCFWALLQRSKPRGKKPQPEFSYLLRRDFTSNADLMRSLAVIDPDPEALLDAGLQKAIEHEALLYVDLKLKHGTERLFFVNTDKGRNAVTQIKAGRIPADIDNLVEILSERPNIYQIYEANIGMLTPIMRDRLVDASKDYPLSWIEEAVQLAVEHNKRSWSYIQAILKRWEREGKNRDIAGRSARQDGQEYVSGQFADFIKR